MGNAAATQWLHLAQRPAHVFARAAAAGDAVARYPVAMTVPPAPRPAHVPARGAIVAAPATRPAVGAAAGAADPFVDPCEDPFSAAGAGDAGGRDSPSAAGGGAGAGRRAAGKSRMPAPVSQQLRKWQRAQKELAPDCERPAMTLAEYEAEKKRKADEWFQEQIEGQTAGGNPNLIPVGGASKMPRR